MSELQSIERKGILVVHRRYGFAKVGLMVNETLLSS